MTRTSPATSRLSPAEQTVAAFAPPHIKPAEYTSGVVEPFHTSPPAFDESHWEARLCPTWTLTGVEVATVASYLPPRRVTNDELAQLGCDAEWIVQRTGIKERRHAGPDMATSDLAIFAAQACLARAGVAPREIDFVLVATVSGDMPTPATACFVQNRLGITAPAMDIGAACSGFMYGLVTGAQFIKAGTARNVLVIGAECMSRMANPADKRTFPLFGDGAGAALLRAGSATQGLLAYTLGSDGSGAELLMQPVGGTRCPATPELLAAGMQYLHMEGRTVFKWAVRMGAAVCRQVLEHAGIGVNDLRCAVLHQANLRIVRAMAEELGLRDDQLIINVNRYGNTSAASIPLVMNDAVEQGRLQRGDKVLLCGFGAGLTWGAAVLEW